jgi:peptidoglycan/LPS O-acetylase OafA/YrhL
MPAPDAATTTIASLILAGLILLAAGGLTVRVWQERRRREEEPRLSVEDAHHFARQERRRLAGTIVMVLLAVGIAVGSRIVPGRDPHLKNLFLAIWAAVIVLIGLLLALALLDWRATRLYAARHLRAILHERHDLIESDQRDRSASPNGQGYRNGPLLHPPDE